MMLFSTLWVTILTGKKVFFVESMMGGEPIRIPAFCISGREMHQLSVFRFLELFRHSRDRVEEKLGSTRCVHPAEKPVLV